MTEKSVSDNDRIADSAEAVGDPGASDPADLDGVAAENAVDDQEAEVDRLAVDAD